MWCKRRTVALSYLEVILRDSRMGLRICSTLNFCTTEQSHEVCRTEAMITQLLEMCSWSQVMEERWCLVSLKKSRIQCLIQLYLK